MVLKKVGILSAAKIVGALYGMLGLIFGAVFSIFALLGAAVGSMGPNSPDAFFGFLFGIGAIVILPVFYGLMGFIFAALTAALYNLTASIVGGLELNIQ